MRISFPFLTQKRDRGSKRGTRHGKISQVRGHTLLKARVLIWRLNRLGADANYRAALGTLPLVKPADCHRCVALLFANKSRVAGE